MNSLLIIAGPTAVGKTSTSIELADRLNGEIVSADSMQVYTGLNIGTAKPDDKERSMAVHHMIDVCHPSQRFSVAQYVKLADAVIEDILSRGKTPIVVGGTGLYIDNLIYSNDFGEFDIDHSVRARLNEEAETRGGEYLLEKLREIDPEYAAKLHYNDTKRIIHALELFFSSGKTQTQLIAESRLQPPKYSYHYSVLDCTSREILYERINRRVDIMIEQGLLEEARRVIDADWYIGSTAAQAIGYKEFEGYFNGTSTLNEAVDLLKQRSRNYAKRQLTWFRHKREAKFYYVDTCDNVADMIISDFKNL